MPTFYSSNKSNGLLPVVFGLTWLSMQDGRESLFAKITGAVREWGNQTLPTASQNIHTIALLLLVPLCSRLLLLWNSCHCFFGSIKTIQHYRWTSKNPKQGCCFFLSFGRCVLPSAWCVARSRQLLFFHSGPLQPPVAASFCVQWALHVVNIYFAVLMICFVISNITGGWLWGLCRALLEPS